MSNQQSSTDRFFVYGGILPLDSASYIVRPADETVCMAVRQGKFCWLSAPHHLGKSSLVLHCAHRLRAEGMQAVVATLTGSDSRTDIDRLFLGILRRLKTELSLPEDLNGWWLSHGDVLPAERFLEFLRDVVLTAVTSPVVLFIDGLDENTNPEFAAGLLSALTTIYGERGHHSRWERLNVVLSGRAVPADFGMATDSPPLAAAVLPELSEFSAAAIAHFRAGFPEATDEQWEIIARHVFSWTNGHPYLTQRLLSEISRMWDNRWTVERVDDLVDTLFFTPSPASLPNLRFILHTIETASNRRAVLKLYGRILAGTSPVQFNATDNRQRRLLVSGLVAVRHGALEVRNQIYRHIFNQTWIKSFSPVNWRFLVAVGVIFACLIAGLFFSVLYRQKEETATQARALIERVQNAPSPTEKLVNLAVLVQLSGYRTEARRVAFEELPREALLAMFSPPNPATVGTELVTVIRGLYTAPQLENSPDADKILEAMRQPLYQLANEKSLDTVELNLEIGQWLKGREFYRGGELYQRAVDAYNIALTVNRQNPAVYFDRALAYAAMGQVNEAFDDFKRAKSLDETWSSRIRQAILDDPVLYATLWNTRADAGLLALVPSPTGTPVPTDTPIPTDTPVPPPTSAPATATPTPTATPVPSPTATATPTPHLPTPTPRRVVPTATRVPVANGTFYLLNPISTESPTYGETEFRWRWTGDLPAGYGFEIRVWADGEPPLGAHDAVRDNQFGKIKFAGGDEYRLTINIKDAAGVRRRSGEYNWAVALVQYQPAYKDLGIVSAPARLRFDVPSSGGNGGGSGGNGGGGGVGIE